MRTTIVCLVLVMAAAGCGREENGAGAASGATTRALRGGEPREVTGVGRRFEANGVVAETADEVYARLLSSSTFASMYVDGGTVRSTDLVLSGLPADGEYALVVNDFQNVHRLRPSDGGVARLRLDLSSPKLIWLEPTGGTLVIGGSEDECAAVGVRDGATCTLTADVSDNVVIAEDGQTLDCAGHAIVPPAAWPGWGVGVLVSQVQGVTVRDCRVGRAGFGFGVGVQIYLARDVEVSASTLTDNLQGVVVQASSGVRVTGNTIGGEMISGIAVQDVAAKTLLEEALPLAGIEISGNTIDLPAEPGEPDPAMVAKKAAGIELRGTLAKFVSAVVADGTPGLAPSTVRDNVVRGGGNGIVLAGIRDAEITGNDLEGNERGLLILDDGWPNRFFHDNVRGS